MTHDLQAIREMKMGGKGGPRMPFEMVQGVMMSGYMHPQMHRNLRRVERFKKRKMRYE